MQTAVNLSSTSYDKRGTALALLHAAKFTVTLDTSRIGVGLTFIKAELVYTQIGLQWIFNAYVILFVATCIIETEALNSGFQTAFISAAVVSAISVLIAAFNIKQPK